MKEQTFLIVESPSKAKTISKYLGAGYAVKASVGHIRDLPTSNTHAIDIEHGFLPHYEIAEGKEKVVAELKAAAKKASRVVLATDPDREGEAIAWHLAEVLKLKKPERIVFHEITKQAVEDALAHPRAIDDKLVRAQEARRVLDRIVGYDLSGLIWKKVRYGLSAGRVQSPALRLVMEREREIRAFTPEQYWILTAHLKTKNGEVVVFTCTEEPRDRATVEKILEAGRAHSWRVTDVEETETARHPSAPFTTSTLQQAASSRLGFAPARTMRLAQKLYEAGLITYMRTDSTTIGSNALAAIAGVVRKKFGDAYAESRVYKTKSKNAQEAHEAIRPTRPDEANAGASAEEKKLYELIWRRAVASQMKDAKVLRTKVSALPDPPAGGPAFAARGSRTLFDGWLAADPRAKGEDIELPKMAAGDPLALVELTDEAKQTEPPSRYTEAGLVKELEKRGIGRPSTYASILHTLVARKYVEKREKTLHPTDVGEVVSDFLERNFKDVVSDTFTAAMEEELDEIARGERDYAKTLSDFYVPFEKEIKEKSSVEKLTTLGDADPAQSCPICGGPMVVKLGKNGKFLSCKKYPACKGARLMDGTEMKGPQETGEACPECNVGKLVIRQGRYGQFVACNRYPKCRYVKKDAPESQQKMFGACPQCGKGELHQKRSRFGIFYGCSRYPECTYTTRKAPETNANA